MLRIPQLLSRADSERMRSELALADWADGKITAGHQSAQAKHNSQLPENHPIAQVHGNTILKALSTNALFISAALPLKVFPPLFNRYSGGEHFGNHVDNAIRQVPQSTHRVRTDLSATLFLTDPDEYDGGELIIETAFDSQRIKLAAGDLILYPATSLHRVEPVTRGSRISSFFWIQSMVRDEHQRSILFDLDTAIRQFRDSDTDSENEALVRLVGVYHNLLRCWADA
jgi:PKHD-type hydroxylase